MVSNLRAQSLLETNSLTTSPGNLQFCCSNHGFYRAWTRFLNYGNTLTTSPSNLQFCCSNHGFYGAWRRLAAEAAAYQLLLLEHNKMQAHSTVQTSVTIRAETPHLANRL